MYIFAHRGASAHAPENTLQAMEIALQQGADGIEIDVHQIGDEFVVIHDHWLCRTTNGSGQLSETDFKSLRSLETANGEPVPTLAEVIKTINGKCDLNIEIKGVSDVACLVDYVEKLGAFVGGTQSIIYSSFNHHLLKQLKSLLPEAQFAALTASNPIDYAAYAESLGAIAANIDITVVDKAFVDDAKKRGLKVFVYTVDQPSDLKKLARWGVDGVFSNDPQNARKVLGLT